MSLSGHYFFLTLMMSILTDQVIAAGKSEIGASSSSSKITKAEKKVDEPLNVLEEKVPSDRLECIADYLVTAKKAKTEIFAQKRGTEWQIRRAIVRKQDFLMEELTINERDMAEDTGADIARECFARNRQFVRKQIVHQQPAVTNDAKGKKKLEYHFTNIRRVFGHQSKKDGNDRRKEKELADFIQIWELFDRSANGRLQVSNKMNNQLEDQSECLANFLAKNFGTEHLHIEQLSHAKSPANEIEILEANKVKTQLWKDEVVHWKWAREAEKGQQKTMPEIRYEQGTSEYAALLKCFELLPLKDGIQRDEGSGKSFIKLRPMVARFRDDQLFVREMPNKDKIFTIDNNSSVLTEHSCSICLDDYAIGDEIKQFYHPCDHLFHKRCIDGWLERKETCPICRGRVKILEKQIHNSDDEYRYSDEEDRYSDDEDRYSDDEDRIMNIRRPVRDFRAQSSGRPIVEGPLRWRAIENSERPVSSEHHIVESNREIGSEVPSDHRIRGMPRFLLQ